MRVFILSLLAVCSVNSHAIHYPYHNQLLAFAPARGEFPVYNDVAQGYLRYYDSNGAEQQLGYNYPEPLYGVRRFSYAIGNNANQLLRTTGPAESGFNAGSYYQLQDSAELAKAREEHFRRWCEQRYQALKAEMEKLRAEGLQPSGDMMAQLKPLEKVISSTTYTSLAELPEIKRIRDEHLRIWNEARLKVLQQEADHLRFHHPEHVTNELKPSFGGIVSDINAIVGETAEQKKAREEHLRIYNEQVQHIKQLEAERLLQFNAKNEADSFANKDHFQQGTFVELKSSLEQGQQQVQQQQQQFQQPAQVMDTPEVMRAREEHLRLVNEAKLRAQAEGTQNTDDDGSYKPEADRIEASPVLKFVPSLQQPIQPIQNIAILQTSQPTQQAFSQHQQSSFVKAASIDFSQPQQQAIQPAQVQDTPEVIRAREEHLKLFNEAKLKAGQQSETSTYIQQAEKVDTYAAKTDDTEKIRESERIREEQRLMEVERQREAERLREEEKQREVERLREIERKKEEERVMETERLRLKQEEDQRLEKERLEEARRLEETKTLEETKRLKVEEKQRVQGQQSSSSGVQANEQLHSQLKSTAAQTFEASGSTSGFASGSSSDSSSGSLSGITSGSSGGSIAGTGFVLSSQYKNNPYLIRFAAQPGATAYVIGEQQASVTGSPSRHYLPAKTDAAGAFKNLRLTQGGQLDAQQQQTTGIQQTEFKPIAASEKISTYSSSSGSLTGGSTTSSIKFNYGASSNSAGLSELEKATRDHFRAHELALEQLRVANHNNPYKKDC